MSLVSSRVKKKREKAKESEDERRGKRRERSCQSRSFDIKEVSYNTSMHEALLPGNDKLSLR